MPSGWLRLASTSKGRARGRGAALADVADFLVWAVLLGFVGRLEVMGRSRRSRGRGTGAGTSRARTGRPAVRCAPTRLRAPGLRRGRRQRGRGPGPRPVIDHDIQMEWGPVSVVVAPRITGGDGAGRLAQQVDGSLRAEHLDPVVAEA